VNRQVIENMRLVIKSDATLPSPKVSPVFDGPIKFDEFSLDCDRYELLRTGRSIKLEKIPMELLILLVGRDGKLVTRQEIINHLWGDEVFVDTEHGINTAIRKIRQALKDDPEQPRFVQTVTGKGYRFIAECRNGHSATVVAEAPPQTIPKTQEPEKIASKNRRAGVSSGMAALGILLVSVIAIELNIGGLHDRIFPGNQVGPIHSIAVLPLTNLSGDPSQEYFADGMTDEMITTLAENHSLRVVSRTSVMQYKGVNKPLREIAHALGVDGILEGSVMRSNGQVHVNLQLIYAPTDTHVWAESYDRSLSDAISLPEEVSQTIAAQAKTPPPAVKAQRYINPEAHDAYLQGRFYWNMVDIARSKPYFERAAQLQPDYAEAWAGLADMYTASAVGWLVPPSEGFPKAEECAQKALALDDSLAEAHNSLAAIYLFHDWNWKKAEAEARRAIALNPNFAGGLNTLSLILFVENRDAEAVQEQKLSAELDPLSQSMGDAYLFIGQPDAAIADFKKHSEFVRDFWTQFDLSTAYKLKGEDRKAAEAMEQALLNVNDGKSAAAVRHAFEKKGIHGVWEWLLSQQLTKAQKKQYVSPWVLAYQYAELGDKEHTLAELEAAYKERAGWLVLLQKEPIFDFLHNEPRYRAIVKNMGLTPTW
jgi:TolB-like protein/DNA-binding winged helix-turn-helix (wHTH) protein